jgi:hypothetical protein
MPTFEIGGIHQVFALERCGSAELGQCSRQIQVCQDDLSDLANEAARYLLPPKIDVLDHQAGQYF